MGVSLVWNSKDGGKKPHPLDCRDCKSVFTFEYGDEREHSFYVGDTICGTDNVWKEEGNAVDCPACGYVNRVYVNKSGKLNGAK